MVSNELDDLLRPLALAQKVIWIAITMSILIYTVVLYMIHASGSQSADGGQVHVVFYAIAALLAIAALIYRQRAFSDDRLRGITEKPVATRSLAINPQTRRVDAERLRRIESLPPKEQGVLNLAQSLTIPTIVVLALNESIAIVGFVAAFLTHNPTAILPFAILAIALNLFVFPRPESLPGRFMR